MKVILINGSPRAHGCTYTGLSIIGEKLAEHGIDIGHVVQHNHWNGKDCPRTIRATPGAWEAFLALCRGEDLAVSALDTAVDRLAEAGMINSPDYWKAGTYSAENVQALLIKWANTL